MQFYNYKYLTLFKYSFCQTLGNKQYLIGKSILYVIATLIFISLWNAVVAEYGNSAPFSLGFIAWYIAINELIVLGNTEVYSRISMDIQSGNIAYYLNKPISYLSMTIAESLGATIAMLSVLGITGIVFLYFYGIACPGVINLIFAFVAIILASTILLLIQALIGLWSYWIGDTFTLVLIMQKLMFVLGGLFVPLTIYPWWLQLVAKYTPFPYMLSETASIANSVSYAVNFQTLSMLVFWVFILVLAVIFSFKKLTRQLEIYGG